MEIKERAMADLKRIEVTIARLEDQLRRAVDDRTKLKHFLEVVNRYSRDPGEEEAEKAPAGGRRNSKAARIRDLAHAFLCERREPVQSGDIAQFVADRGEDIPGADKGSYVSSVLNRDGRFTNLRNLGWVLASDGGDQAKSEPEDEGSPATVATPDFDDYGDLEEAPNAAYARPEPEPEPQRPPQRPQFRPAAPVPQMRVVQAARPVQRPSVADELDDDIPF